MHLINLKIMKTKYTKSYILSNRGCRDKELVLTMDFMVAKNYTYEGIINSKDLTITDKFWWLMFHTKLTETEMINILIEIQKKAIVSAEIKSRFKWIIKRYKDGHFINYDIQSTIARVENIKGQDKKLTDVLRSY